MKNEDDLAQNFFDCSFYPEWLKEAPPFFTPADIDEIKYDVLYGYFGFEDLKTKIFEIDILGLCLNNFEQNETLKQNNITGDILFNWIDERDRKAKKLEKEIHNTFWHYLGECLMTIEPLIERQRFLKNRVKNKNLEYYVFCLEKLDLFFTPFSYDFWRDCISEGMDNYEKRRKDDKEYLKLNLTRGATNHIAPESKPLKKGSLEPQHSTYVHRGIKYSNKEYALSYLVDCWAINKDPLLGKKKRLVNLLAEKFKKYEANGTSAYNQLLDLWELTEKTVTHEALNKCIGDEWEETLLRLSSSPENLKAYLTQMKPIN